MAVIILIVHLILCVGLIGLVLLQRSEGGALGIGGGGGGSLMSGRGAADALARLTSIAGGLFLVTSLGLTMLSGASSNANERSVFDLIPALTREAPETSPFTDPASDDTTALEPQTELVSAEPAVIAPDLGAAIDNGLPVAPAPDSASARAGPVAAPTQTAPAETAVLRSASAERPTASPAATTPRATAPRSAPAPARQTPASTPAQTPTRTPARAPVQTARTETAPPAAEANPGTSESGDNSPQVEVVRRERAGPDQ